MSNGGPYVGKFRGTVTNNNDPMRMGRLQAIVPDVTGPAPSTWALPNVPFAGTQAGVYVVPPPGAGVWMEFERGDPDYPIWTGCWWGSAAEVPSLAAAPPPLHNVVLQTPGQTAIVVSDAPGPQGGIMLRSATGATIQVNDVGITISNGKGATIVLSGPSVDVNNGALVVT
jgi:uncharacterized protein involved in type VI secretion and phage assembly